MVKDKYAEAMPAPDYRDDLEHAVAYLTITKVVRENQPIVRGAAEHNTLGKVIDDMLADVAMQGGEVQSFELEVTSDYWREFAEKVRGKANGR
jgi:hypothetical protein